MENILKKLQTLKTSFESVEHNARFPHDNPATRRLGEIEIDKRLSAYLDEIIQEIKDLQLAGVK